MEIKMKRIISILAASILIIAAFAVPASAADDAEYDEVALRETLRDAFELYSEFFDAYYGQDFDAETVEFYPDPYPDIGRPYDYARRTDKYRIWDDFISALEKSYTKEIKSQFLHRVEATEKDGYTYSCTVYGMAQGKRYLLESEDFSDVSLENSFRIVSVEKDVIAASFKILNTREPDVTEHTVEFTYEDGAWRVSGGTFVDELITARELSPFYTGKSPDTGDRGVVFLLLAIISATVISTKRRRRV